MNAGSTSADILYIAGFATVTRLVENIAFTLLYYDYLLTLPLELERYWTGGRSWASALFFLNRYLSLLGHVPVFYEYFGLMPETRCRTMQLYHQLFAGFTQLTVGALLMLRTYALYNRSREVMCLLCAVCALGMSICGWALFCSWRLSKGSPGASVDIDVILALGCDLQISQQQGYYLAAAWSSIMVFDATVFALTLWQALRIGKMWSHSLFHLLLRDGTIYFGILAVCYLSNILTYALAQPLHKGVLTTLTNVISATLVTRMMLNIRNPDLLQLPHRWPSERIDI